MSWWDCFGSKTVKSFQSLISYLNIDIKLYIGVCVWALVGLGDMAGNWYYSLSKALRLSDWHMALVFFLAAFQFSKLSDLL